MLAIYPPIQILKLIPIAYTKVKIIAQPNSQPEFRAWVSLMIKMTHETSHTSDQLMQDYSLVILASMQQLQFRLYSIEGPRADKSPWP